MAKPYSIFKARNGIYYVQFRLSDGSRSSSKSTGCRNKTEAERKAMEWVVNGQIPARINSKNESESFTSVDKIKFLNDLRTTNFSEEDIKSIVNILKERKFITSAVIYQSPEDKPIEDFLLTFWDFEKSPYVKEKKLKSQSIHQSYCATMKSRVEIYWIPMLKGRSIGSITRKDVQAIFENEIVLKLAPKTINSIVSSITVPLKWAFYNELTENNCFDGILKCGQKSKTRDILTLEQAAAVFKIPWENDSAKLANMLALYTGMRQGEIAGLQLQDIGVDRIYIRHSWSKYEGLKETKTNESREIKIPPKVRDDLLMQASFNPYNEGQSGFVFFGLLRKQPTDPKNWLKYFRRALKESGHPAPNKICFHAYKVINIFIIFIFN
jgi:integrase